MNFTQDTFGGGLNQSVESTQIVAGELWQLRNGRIRDGLITPIKKPLLLQEGTNAQGIYSIGSQVLFFVDGQAWFRDYQVPNSAFQQIAGFQMSAVNTYLFAVGVPSSSINFKRKSNADVANNGITLQDSITQASAAAIVTDGESLPVILISGENPRTAKQYNDWTVDVPEYVPAGANMLMYDETLYMLSTDRTKIYRSVNGRPTNFMIVIDSEGNKLENEAAGGADAVSHAISNAPINCLAGINIDADGFYAGVDNASYIVMPDWENTLFAEPRFRNAGPVADSSALNQFSIFGLSQGTVFINKSGIRMFNAAPNTKDSGKNFPFSRQIYKLFQISDNELIQQDVCCGINYDDYAHFAVKTKHGYRIIIYDDSRGQFVSCDEWDIDGAAIKMFCEVKIGAIRKLLFITNTGKLYEAYASEQFETVGAYIGDRPNVKQDQNIPSNSYFRPVQSLIRFTEAYHDGLVYATPYVDGKKGTRKAQYVKAEEVELSYPVAFPVEAEEDEKTKAATITWPSEKIGSEVGLFVEWSFNASLMDVTLMTNVMNEEVSKEQRVQAHASMAGGIVKINTVSSYAVQPTQNIVLGGTRLDKITAVYLGLSQCNFQTQGNSQLTIVVPGTMATGNYVLTLVSNNLTTEIENEFNVI